MWLHGWGYILDRYSEASRIVQFPGDIDLIANRTTFFIEVDNFISFGDPWDIVIGDFTTGDQFSAKDLIDLFGTIPLLANWFPDVAKAIHGLALQRPRSEFLNVRTSVLRQLLDYRKFAYDQTLNMLIHAWDFAGSDWKYRITRHSLGTLQDDKSARRYRECLDQIERTERMLKLLWREIYEPAASATPAALTQLFNEYDVLDQRSTAIRETARITIRSLLGM
jgi:hypothetical protein